MSLAAQLRDIELVAHDAAPVLLDQRDGEMVLAAFGVCGTLAVVNVGRVEHCDPQIVAKDAADSTAAIAVALSQADDRPAQIRGMTVVVGRKVLSIVR